MGDPYKSEVCHSKGSADTVVSLSVFHGVDGVDDELTVRGLEQPCRWEVDECAELWMDRVVTWRLGRKERCRLATRRAASWIH